MLLAVADGEAIPIDTVEDEVFSSRMLGDGFAVDPKSGNFFSPADGVIENISETLHAYTLRTDDGLDILIHIGIDTVELSGKGFTPFVKKGDRVSAGDLIARADLGLIKENGFSAVTPVIISNYDEISSYDISLGDVTGGKSTVIKYIRSE